MKQRKPTMSELIHYAEPPNKWRFGFRIQQVCYAKNLFNIIDEENDWTTLDQARKSAEKYWEFFGKSSVDEDGNEWYTEILFYRYTITVENLCGSTWTNIVP